MPLYHQLKELLRERVDSGEFQPGEQIPVERELCEVYGVSRITVRQALQALVGEGLLARQQGVGTFVATPKVEQGEVQLGSFTEEMQAQGRKPGARVISIETIPVPTRVARALQLRVGEEVVRLERVRLADEEPMGLQIAYIPSTRCPDLEKHRESLKGSLYQLLESKYGLRPVRARELYAPALVDEYEAQLLGVEPGSLALLVERTTYTSDGRPLEFVRSLMRGDRYRISVQLER